MANSEAVTAKRHLSGWLRLWVFVGLLYGLVVSFFAWNAWPPESGIRTYTVEEEGSGEVFEFKFFGEPTQAQIQSVEHLRKPETIRALSSGKYLSVDPNAGTSSAVSELKIEGRGSVFFPSNTSEFLMTEAFNRWDDPWRERREVLVAASMWWAGPMLFLLGLGWGIGWVVRGFRGGKDL